MTVRLTPQELAHAEALADAVYAGVQRRLASVPQCRATTHGGKRCVNDAVALGHGDFCGIHHRLRAQGRLDAEGKPIKRDKPKT